MLPGAPMDDAPVTVGVNDLAAARAGCAAGFVISCSATRPAARRGVVPVAGDIGVRHCLSGRRRPDAWSMPRASAARRCDGRQGTVYLLRPDQHVAARWRAFDAAAVQAALARALCLN